MSAADQRQKASVGGPSSVSPARAAPGAGGRGFRRRPANFLELVHDALADWSRTLRLVVLALTAALCAASVIFVIQLHADRWGSVVAVAISVTAAIAAGRLRIGGRSPREPPGQR
jgi:hypothetical protein